MKSQSSQYPMITQYTESDVAVPINITAVEHPENGTQYEFDLIILSQPGDTNNLNAVKSYLNAAIKAYHDELILQGCQTSFGFKVDCQAKNVVDWSAALQLLQLSGGTEIDICDYDNATHTLTAAQYAQMCGEIGQYLAELRAEKWRIRTAIDAAGSIDDAYAAAKWD